MCFFYCCFTDVVVVATVAVAEAAATGADVVDDRVCFPVFGGFVDAAHGDVFADVVYALVVNVFFVAAYAAAEFC